MIPQSHQKSLSQGVWQDPLGKSPHMLFWFAASGECFCDPRLLLRPSHQSPILQISNTHTHTHIFRIRLCRKTRDSNESTFKYCIQFLLLGFQDKKKAP